MNIRIDVKGEVGLEPRPRVSWMGVFVGIYATSYQWGQITGNQLSYPGIPLWVPGAATLSNDPKSAMALCTGTIPNYVPFAGGVVTLMQFGYINGPPYPFDQNYACPRSHRLEVLAASRVPRADEPWSVSWASPLMAG
jgi:hypothetical protein